MKRSFDDILSQCLDRMAQGDSIQECLARHPDHAQELAPLLQVARAAMEAALSLEPRPEFKAQTLYRLSKRLAERRPRRGWPLAWMPPPARPVLLAFGAVLLLVAALGGTTVAANDSVPGQPLYFAKRAKERLLQLIPRSDIAQARLEANLAKERGRELAALVSQGKEDEVEKAVQRIQERLDKAAFNAVRKTSPGRSHATQQLRDRIKEDFQAFQRSFGLILEQAPPAARPFIRQTMERSTDTYRAAIGALGETSGTIAAVDPFSRSIVLHPPVGDPVRLIITPASLIKLDGQEVTAGRLTRGSRVAVDYDPHTREVRVIEIQGGQ